MSQKLFPTTKHRSIAWNWIYIPMGKIIQWAKSSWKKKDNKAWDIFSIAMHIFSIAFVAMSRQFIFLLNLILFWEDFFFFLYFRRVLNSQKSSCLIFPSPGLMSVLHHTQLIFFGCLLSIAYFSKPRYLSCSAQAHLTLSSLRPLLWVSWLQSWPMSHSYCYVWPSLW